MQESKIKCEKCNRTICVGVLPATVTIKCSGCGHENKLNNRVEYAVIVNTPQQVTVKYGISKKIR